MGSKNRVAKYIIPIIEEYRAGRVWVEPFVGGGNMIDKVTGPRVGFDLNDDVISALCLIRDNVSLIPRDRNEFSESQYKKKSVDRPHLAGFASFVYSFGGKHWGGWSRDADNSDYIKRGFNAAVKQSPNLQGVTLKQSSYLDIKLSESCVIYCDPPYAGTTKYKTGSFDHSMFWSWCRHMADQGHTVFVSEYSAPPFARVVWEKPLTSSIRRKDDAKTTEKLYI